MLLPSNSGTSSIMASRLVGRRRLQRLPRKRQQRGVKLLRRRKARRAIMSPGSWRRDSRDVNLILTSRSNLALEELMGERGRAGQCGRADGYILEGRELEFYMKKIQRKKGKGTGAAA
ncbi:unnamed protein product [Musa textilis]